MSIILQLAEPSYSLTSHCIAPPALSASFHKLTHKLKQHNFVELVCIVERLAYLANNALVTLLIFAR